MGQDPKAETDRKKHEVAAAAMPDAGMVTMPAVGTATAKAKDAPDPNKEILQYIPAEAVATYLGLEAAIKTFIPAPVRVQAEAVNVPAIAVGTLWIVFIAIMAGAPFIYERRFSRPKPGRMVITAVSFAIWVFAIGGPFVTFDWYRSLPFLKLVVIGLFTYYVKVFSARKA